MPLDQDIDADCHAICRNPGEGDEETEPLRRRSTTSFWRKPMTKLEWDAERHRRVLAGRVADDLVQRQRYKAPIDPLKIVERERDFCVPVGGM